MSKKMMQTICVLFATMLLIAWTTFSTSRSTASAANQEPASGTATAAASDNKTTDPSCGCVHHGFREQPPLVLTGKPAPGEDLVETARMHRMSDNLLKPQLHLSSDMAAARREQWVKRFRNESNPLLREEIITEMVQLDDAKTLDAMLALFDGESHPGVRDQIILIVGYMSATNKAMPQVCQRMLSAYERGEDHFERARMLDILSNIPAPEAVAFMRSAFLSPRSSPDDRFNAVAGLFKLSPRVKVDADLARTATDWLKREARQAADVQDRANAARVLAAAGQNNKAFLRSLLNSERDPGLHRFLALAAEEYPTH